MMVNGINFNTEEFLQARGWKLYRTAWLGKPEQWLSPYDNKVYPLKQAVKIERTKGAK